MSSRRESLILYAISTVANISKNLLEEREEEDEEILQTVQELYLNANERVSISDYSDKVIPRYTLSDFKSHFRLEKTTFEALLTYLRPKLTSERIDHRPAVSVEKQLQIAIWTLANQEVYRSIADRFGVNKKSVWNYVVNISKILCDNISDFMRWPSSVEASVQQNLFMERSRFPGIVGVIDGCDLPISRLSNFPQAYVCRKKYHAMKLQGICDFKRKFIDVDVGWVGSAHDARVFRNSDIKALIEEKREEMFPKDGHLVGDSAYPNLEYLLVPFRDLGDLTENQKKYNTRLSCARVRIEQAFGILIARFPRLKYIYLRRIDLIPAVVLAACALHNLCIDKKDFIETEPRNNDDADIPNDDNSPSRTGNEKRNRIMNSL